MEEAVATPAKKPAANKSSTKTSNAQPKEKRKPPSPNPEEYLRCMECGCPWYPEETDPDVDYNDLPSSWRQNEWRKAVKDPNHKDHAEAVAGLKDYMKERWDEAFNEFFDAVERFGEFHPRRVQYPSIYKLTEGMPSTPDEMIAELIEQEPPEHWYCYTCFDYNAGGRNYEYHPDPKVRKREGYGWSQAYELGE